MNDSHLDLERRNLLNKLHDRAGKNLFQKMVALFLADGKKVIQEISNSIDRQDREKTLSLTHYLKGAGQNVGAQSVVSSCRNIEEFIGSVEGFDRSMVSSLDTIMKGLYENLDSFKKEASFQTTQNT